MNNSLTKTSYYQGLNTYAEETTVQVMNPLSSDLGVMRQTLLFGGLESVCRNVNRKNGNIRFFEFGNCYHYSPEKKNDDDPVKAYSEECHLGLWLSGNSVQGSWIHADEKSSFYQLKAYVENIFARVGLVAGTVVTEKSDNNIFAKGLTVKNRGGKVIAEMGVVCPKLLSGMGISVDVFYADINWDALMKAVRNKELLFHDICKYPAVSRDLALLIDKDVEFDAIVAIAKQTEKKLLKKVTLFDVYEGKNLPAGKKSYAVNFILQDETKTLNDKQIDAMMNKLIANLKSKLGAELR